MATTEKDQQRREHEAALKDAREGVPPARPGDPANAIECRDVTKTYDVSKAGVRDATFSIRRGEFVFMVGPTGSGKSTLMRLLIKELEPDEGSILVAGTARWCRYYSDLFFAGQDRSCEPLGAWPVCR